MKVLLNALVFNESLVSIENSSSRIVGKLLCSLKNYF